VDKVTQNPETVQCGALTGSGQKLEESSGYSFTETTDVTV